MGKLQISKKLLIAFSILGALTMLMVFLNFSALQAILEFNHSIEGTFDAFIQELNNGTDAEALERLAGELRATMDRSDVRVEGTIIFNGILMALTIGIVILMWRVFDNVIGKPVRLVNDKIKLITNGDLTTEFPEADEKNKDEIANMNKSMSEMTKSLNGIIRNATNISHNVNEAMDDLNDGAATISESAYGISSAVNEVANGASATADDTTRAAEIVGNIGENITGIKKSTDDLTTASNNMNDAKNDVIKILDDFVLVNNNMNKTVDETNTQINITSENVKEIQKFIEVIKDIASQTNLLSLNASIEAAHSGEAGKGFAVVATEIRRLSEQSAKSSEEIEQTLNTLISNYGLIVEKMKETNDNINFQKEKLVETRSNFNILDEDIGVTVERIKEINSMVNELDNMRNGLIDIIANLSAISQENAASAEETTASIEELTSTMTQMCEGIGDVKQRAQELLDSISVFKIDLTQ